MSRALPSPRLLPLTALQRQLWRAARIGEDRSTAFSDAVSIRLAGPLSAAALRRALAALRARHDALRLRIAADGSQQTIAPAAPPALSVLNLSLLSRGARAARLEEVHDEERREPFDLVRGPLVRTRLVRLVPDDHVLVLAAHHLACDGPSIDVLLSDLGRLYAAAAGERAATLEPAPSFAEYVTRETGRERTAAATRDAAFFAERLAPLPPPLDLPLDHPRFALRSRAAANASRTISGDRARAVLRAGARQGCSPFATLLAGFTALLHRLSGAGRLLVAVPTTPASEPVGLVAPAARDLPLLSRVSPETPAADHLRETSRALRAIAEHGAATPGEILSLLPRRPADGALASARFGVGRIGRELRMPGLRLSVRTLPARTPLADFSLNVVETDDGLVLESSYAAALFDPATVTRWLACYEALLVAIAADPLVSLSALPLVGAMDRRATRGDRRAHRRAPTAGLVRRGATT